MTKCNFVLSCKIIVTDISSDLKSSICMVLNKTFETFHVKNSKHGHIWRLIRITSLSSRLGHGMIETQLAYCYTRVFQYVIKIALIGNIYSVCNKSSFHKWVGAWCYVLAWPTVVQLLVSFNSGLQWGIRVLFLCFVTVIDLILCFHWDALVELGSHYANRTFYGYYFVLRIISGPRVKFVQWKAFKPPGSVYRRELVFVIIVHLFVSYAHVNLCHFFSSSWCRVLAAASVCGSSWTVLFTFLYTRTRAILGVFIMIFRVFFLVIHASVTSSITVQLTSTFQMISISKVH